MEQSFWHERWSSGRIAFHEGEVNAILRDHVDLLGSRVFLPLCGKAVDLAWLAAREHEVVGAELDAIAVEAFFAEQDQTPDIDAAGPLKRYRAGAVTIFQGDIFALTADALGPVDAVFDRAALVALPPAMRVDYAQHLASLTAHAPQLLVTYEYDNPAMQGPPHSVPPTEVLDHYGAEYTVTELLRAPITGLLTQRTTGSEVAYHLTPR
ncbi:MAG: thiopurine S-methyltransferase [Pseudomonadota bacterium]